MTRVTVELAPGVKLTALPRSGKVFIRIGCSTIHVEPDVARQMAVAVNLVADQVEEGSNGE